MQKLILVAEDSPTIRKFISFALASKGYNTILASDGMEALEKISGKKIDLIITDLNMPNIDGYELIQSLRTNQEYKETPIIILSSLGGKREIERGMNVGADSFLVKPFNPHAILYEISKYIN